MPPSLKLHCSNNAGQHSPPTVGQCSPATNTTAMLTARRTFGSRACKLPTVQEVGKSIVSFFFSFSFFFLKNISCFRCVFCLHNTHTHTFIHTRLLFVLAFLNLFLFFYSRSVDYIFAMLLSILFSRWLVFLVLVLSRVENTDNGRFWIHAIHFFFRFVIVPRVQHFQLARRNFINNVN